MARNPGSINKRYAALRVAALAMLVASCVLRQPVGTPIAAGSQASPTLAPSMFYEEGRLAFLAVNTHLARFSLEADLLPLEIAVANHGLEKLTFHPEGITLRSPDGRRWPVASPGESAGSSLRSAFDRRTEALPFEEVLRHRFRMKRYVASTFGLRGGNRTLTRSTTLARNSWTMAQVWFPNPGGELKGELFEVWLDAPELPAPIFTRIRF